MVFITVLVFIILVQPSHSYHHKLTIFTFENGKYFYIWSTSTLSTLTHLKCSTLWYICHRLWQHSRSQGHTSASGCLNPFMPTVPTFAVRETSVSRTANVGTVAKNGLKQQPNKNNHSVKVECAASNRQQNNVSADIAYILIKIWVEIFFNSRGYQLLGWTSRNRDTNFFNFGHHSLYIEKKKTLHFDWLILEHVQNMLTLVIAIIANWNFPGYSDKDSELILSKYLCKFTRIVCTSWNVPFGTAFLFYTWIWTQYLSKQK